MAYESAPVLVTFPAGEDLSGATAQNTIVALNSDNKVYFADNITYQSVGILVNGDVTNQPCTVQIGGIGKVVLGGTLAVNANVSAEADTGKAIAVASTAWSIGMLVDGGAEDELVSINIQPATVAA